MAFEAAHQLRKLGAKVELVILIDSAARRTSPYKLGFQIWRQSWKQPPRGTGKDRALESLASRMRDSWNTTWWLLGKAMNRLLSHFGRPEPNLAGLTGLLDEQSMPIPEWIVDRLYTEIEKTHFPSRLDARGLLFRTDDIAGKQAIRPRDDTLGWKNLFTQGLEIVPLAGDHFNIFREQTPLIAREINRALKWHALDQDINVSLDADKL
jgi:thioesterase domain-containing protein